MTTFPQYITDFNDMAIVVRELADTFYEEFANENTSRKALPSATPWEREIKSHPRDGENHSLDEF